VRMAEENVAERAWLDPSAMDGTAVRWGRTFSPVPQRWPLHICTAIRGACNAEGGYHERLKVGTRTSFDGQPVSLLSNWLRWQVVCLQARRGARGGVGG
jgi:hypothetical protein